MCVESIVYSPHTSRRNLRMTCGDYEHHSPHNSELSQGSWLVSSLLLFCDALDLLGDGTLAAARCQ
jgi:hypothetical protein